MDFLNSEMVGDYLALGGTGFVCGVVIPLGFRLVGYVVDSVRVVLRGV